MVPRRTADSISNRPSVLGDTSKKVASDSEGFESKRAQMKSLSHAILATALFRCWHILLFFGAWASAVCLISHYVHDLAIESTLLTVIGTVLGFVISYRTTSSFERYNEGRRLWSQIILANRTFARVVWFHAPDATPADPKGEVSLEERKMRATIEKKTVINLLEGFAVAVKHYLRGEDGIYYADLYHLVKYLPPYGLPHGIPSSAELDNIDSPSDTAISMRATGNGNMTDATAPSGLFASSVPHLPMPISTSGAGSPNKKTTFLQPLPTSRHRTKSNITVQITEKGRSSTTSVNSEDNASNTGFLLPARMPPKYHLFDIFPFSLLVHGMTKSGLEVKGKKAARMRARMRGRAGTESHNLPLEISLYLSSYIAALQARKVLDAPTTTMLFQSLGQLVDALTGLERILTTPIPFSYAIHLWVVTIIYCFVLPFQIWSTLKWLTIPATVILSFIFFGFLVAGEEIENPFGYDKNDLNMDHFTKNIIRNELRAITATPAPDPSIWAFSTANDRIFASNGEDSERITPSEWVAKGLPKMQAALSSS